MGSRYILAVVLMLAVMIAWTLIFGNRFAPEPTDPTTPEQTPQTNTTENSLEDSPDSVQPQIIQVNPDDPVIQVTTDTYEIEFNEKLAIAKQWELTEKNDKGELRFPDRSDTNIIVPMNLIPEAALNCLALRLGNEDLQLDLDLRRATWDADKEAITLSESKDRETLTFTTTIDDVLQVAKKFTFYNTSYTVDLDLTFENITDDSQLVQIGGNELSNGYELRWGAGINADLLIHEKESGKRGRFDPKKEGSKTYIGTGKPKKELKDELAYANVLWASINNQYFTAVMIPDPQLQATYKLDKPETKAPSDVFVAAPTETTVLTIPNFQLSSQQKKTHSFRLYVGS